MITQKIQKAFFKVSDFISWQKSDILILTPKFQRRSVWKKGAKSYLIDTIVRGLPIPIIFMRDYRTTPDQIEPIKEVVDGQQRLRTVISFVTPHLLKDFDKERDAFSIQKNHNKDLAGKPFKDLDDESKEAILNYTFDVHVLPSSVDDRDIVRIFRRMNSTSYALKKQELRNANFYGDFKTSVYQSAAEQLERWRKWKTFTEDEIARMDEVELVSECYLMIKEGKISGKSASKLDKAYEKYDETFEGKTHIESRFRTIMDVADANFAKDLPEFIFLDRRVLFTFLAFIYDLVFGLDAPIRRSLKARLLTPLQIAAIKVASKRIKNRTADKAILEATDRRTTNPKERSLLFNYLKKSIKGA